MQRPGWRPDPAEHEARRTGGPPYLAGVGSEA